MTILGLWMKMCFFTQTPVLKAPILWSVTEFWWKPRTIQQCLLNGTPQEFKFFQRLINRHLGTRIARVIIQIIPTLIMQCLHPLITWMDLLGETIKDLKLLLVEGERDLEHEIEKMMKLREKGVGKNESGREKKRRRNRRFEGGLDPPNQDGVPESCPDIWYRFPR